MPSNLANMDYNASIGINNLWVGTGIENKAVYSINYSPLENSIIEPQLSQEAEDMPEAIHTPWGIWIHKRDPLHSIHQRFDTEHLIRTGMVAEDILHYAHYVPIIEGPDHERAAESHEIEFECDYSPNLGLYNAEFNFGKEFEDEATDNRLELEVMQENDVLDANSKTDEQINGEGEAMDVLSEIQNESYSGIEQRLLQIIDKLVFESKFQTRISFLD